mmetsp:Transcript_26970/g.56334  ORF Transcript_26970/g.56334 Transcript_26970/m.56334 type:complete len:828 (+) Transcript_26970:23-2506(+)
MMSTPSWQASLFKLVSLIVVLPFIASYLYFHYYAFWQNEYCFVGPFNSLITGRSRGSSASIISSLDASANDVYDVSNNEIKPIASTNRNSRSSELASVSLRSFYGIYAPEGNQKQRKKKGGGKSDNLDRRTFRQKYTSHPIHSSSSSYFSSFSWQRWLSTRHGWPSITETALMISAPFSQLSKYRAYGAPQDGSSNYNHAISVVENKDEVKWCLQSSSTNEEKLVWCSDSLGRSSGNVIYMYPPSGSWKFTPDPSNVAQNDDSYQPTISISCPYPAISKETKTKNNRHKQQNSKQNQNLQFLLQKPTTTLLLLLNVYLAFHYWNHRINPSSLSKNYNKILDNHEWWRSFTGATAHFEPLHIGFNMMSLHSLGRELEGVNGFNSIVFLVYNIAMVVMTTAVMMGMVYGRLRYIQYKLSQTASPQLQQELEGRQQRLRETSAVGFSAVLFAWMVITTLERNQPTCPIPFLNDVCFSTYSFGLLKFNISPIVQLFFAQFIMPRVSFMGHLAGIVCGFGLHWGWGMPPLEVCSPNVLIGGVYLIGCLWWRRRVVPVRPLLEAVSTNGDWTGDDNDEQGDWRTLLMEGAPREVDATHGYDAENGNDSEQISDPFMRSKRKKKELELEEVGRKYKILVSIRNLLGFVTVSSFYVFNWTGSLVISQSILFFYFVSGTQSSLVIWTYTHCTKCGNDIIDPEKQRAGMVWRGFLMSCVITIAVDSMSFAAFTIARTFVSAEAASMRVGLLPAALFMLLRISINIIGLVLSSKILHDYGQVGGGIFGNVFSWVISSSKLIGDGIFLSQKPLWTAFEGRGKRLGGGELLSRASQSRAI